MVLLIHATLTVGVTKTSMQFKKETFKIDFLITEMIGPYVFIIHAINSSRMFSFCEYHIGNPYG